MSEPNSAGPVTWIQPHLTGQHLIVNGSATGVELSDLSKETEAAGVVVDTASGQQVPHVLLVSPDAPATLQKIEFDLSWQQATTEDVRRHMARIPAFSAQGLLRVYLDVSFYDLWIGDGARTTHVLSKSTAYGTTGVSFADRPARAFVNDGELTHTEGSPAPGEFQLSETADSTSIVLGTAPASGAVVELAYYPLWPCTAANFEEEMEAFNDWSGSVSFTSFTELREY